MHLFSAANGVHEHRLLHAMQEGPEAMPVAAVTVEQRILHEMQNMNERVNRFDLTKDRKDAVERQRKIIEAKFDDIQHRAKTENKEYQEERNALLREVDELVSYAEYQAAQETENRQAGRVERQDDRLKDVSIEESGGRRHIFIKAPRDAVLRFTYVSRTPEIARVLGVMTFDARTVSMNMRNRFHVSRTQDKDGNHYFAVTPDDVFDGTFSFYIGNQHRTVDWMNAATRSTVESQKKQREEREKNLSLAGLEEQLKEAAGQLLQILGRIEKLQENPAAIRPEDIKALQEQKARLQERIQELKKKILEYRQRHGLITEEPTPDRSLPITNGMQAPLAPPQQETPHEKRIREIQAHIEGKEGHIGTLKNEEQAISERIKTIRLLLTNPDPNEPILTEQQEKVLEDELKVKQTELAYMQAEIRRQEEFLGQSKRSLEKLQRKEK